jgi:hypothetical protein
MEDKYSYMKPKNKCLPLLILDGKQYIFNYLNSDPVRKTDEKSSKSKFGENTVQFVLYLDGILDEDCFINENGVIEYHDPHCKNCFSNDVIKKSFNKRKIYLENGVSVIIKVKRYLCKKCRKYSQVRFNGIYEDYCNFSNRIKNKAINIRTRGWDSLRNLTWTLNVCNSIKMSYETIRQSLLIHDGLYFLNENFKPSGYVAYDVQWIRINKIWHYRHVLFDIVHKIPIAELLAKKEDSKTTKNFIKNSIQPKDSIAIVTDLKPSYDKIMRELGFVHQHCTFHLLLNIYNTLSPELTKIRKEFERDLKNMELNLSDNEIKEKSKQFISNYKSEINEYLSLIYQLFKQQTYDKAIQYIDLLKRESINFPKLLKDYVDEKFFPEYKKFIYFLEKRHKGKLDNTNNQIENYIGNTMPRAHKKKFRTMEGVFNQIMLQKNGWIEKRNQELTF